MQFFFWNVYECFILFKIQTAVHAKYAYYRALCMKDVISAISSGPSARGLPVQVRPAPWVLSSWPRPRPCARRPGAAPTEPGRRRLCMPCEAAEGHEAR